MRIVSLCAAMACAIGSYHPPLAMAASVSDPGLQPVPTLRYLPLTDLPTFAASLPASAPVWSPTGSAPVSSGNIASPGKPVVAVVNASLLADPVARADAFRVLSTGIGVLVVAQPGEPRYDANVFGIEGDGDVVLYQPGANGTLHVFTAPRISEPAALADAWERIRDTAQTAVAEWQAHDEKPPEIAAPRKVWIVSEQGPEGRYTTQRITVTRNTTTSADFKSITVKTDTAAKPYRNGVTDDFRSFRRDGKGLALLLVNAYTASTSLSWPRGENPGIKPLEHYPATSNETDIDFSRTHTTTTSFGIGASPEVTQNLADKKISTTGKLPINLNFSKSQAVTEAVSMKVKDYSVAFSQRTVIHPATGKQASEAGGEAIATWTFPLAAPIAGKSDYFSTKRGTQSTANMTPMMREAGLETISTWKVDGNYEGRITIASGVMIESREHMNILKDIVDIVPDCPSTYDAGKKRCGKGGANLQPRSVATIDLSSPYLTRNPAILLQSFSAPDACLTQEHPTLRTLRLKSCIRMDAAREMQWELDEASRYVNRASKMCLDAHPASGELTAAPCSSALTQQWDWNADRIHSRYSSGMARIAVDGDKLRVGFGSEQLPFLPRNPTDALLPPWNAYPDNATSKDFVPGFSLTPARVTPEYLSYRVTDGERWSTIPLREGLN